MFFTFQNGYVPNSSSFLFQAHIPHRVYANYFKLNQSNIIIFQSFHWHYIHVFIWVFTSVQWNLVITRSLGPWKLPCYIRVKKLRNIKSWDQQNYLVIRGFCYIRPLYNEVSLYRKSGLLWTDLHYFDKYLDNDDLNSRFHMGIIKYHVRVTHILHTQLQPIVTFWNINCWTLFKINPVFGVTLDT